MAISGMLGQRLMIAAQEGRAADQHADADGKRVDGGEHGKRTGPLAV